MSNQTPYSKIVSCYDHPPKLQGRTIRAFHSEYSFAALQLDNGEIVAFAVEEESAGKWFEVFPICPDTLHPECSVLWTDLAVPLTVLRCEVMWREEWLVPAKNNSALVGSGPHYVQCVSTVGSAPESSTNVVKVLAGIRLTGCREHSLLICSSDNTPFKVDLATDPAEIQRIMQFHTCG